MQEHLPDFLFIYGACGVVVFGEYGCIHCEWKTSIHSFTHYSSDAEEAHHLWHVRGPTNKRAQKKLVCFAKREGGKLVN